MIRRRRLFASALAAVPSLSSAAFRDPLDGAAATVRSPQQRSLLGVALAGKRLVAVGMRGLVVSSDDEGDSWQQVPLRLASDLVCVSFTSATRGWAGGHDGVILGTEDGGRTWTPRLDGRKMAQILIQHFDRARSEGRPQADKYLEAVKLNFAAGPEQPILGVWFDDESTGWAVSTFGMVIGTRDGGRTWASWMEQVDNPELLHLYSITGVKGEVYVTAEHGNVFKLDRSKQRFALLNTGYDGGLFGVVGVRNTLLTFGLRGNALRSRDGGGSWERLDTGVRAGLNAGVALPDGRMALVTQDGRLLVSGDLGSSFQPARVPRPGLLAGLAAQGDKLVVVGFGGVQRIKL